MRGSKVRKGRLIALAAALVIGGTFAVPSFANARLTFEERNAKKARCPLQRHLIRIDQKVCPANPRRGPIIVLRACCEDRRGRLHCKKFLKCPKRSPSGRDDD
jgi:hypothetical protein